MTRYADKLTTNAGRGMSAEIRIEGLEQTLGILRGLDEEVYKRLNKDLRLAGKEIARDASMQFAMTGHGMGRYQVKMRTAGRNPGLSIFVPKGARDEAIFEIAGTKMRSRSGGDITPQGAGMVSWLNRRFGKPGRFLWDAYDANKAHFDRDLRSAMDEAEATIQRHLDAAGETY